MKTNINRIIKLRALTLKARILLKDYKELREAIQLEYSSIPYEYGFTKTYIEHIAKYSIKEFNRLLKEQNKLLIKLSKINKQRRLYRVYKPSKQLLINY